MSSGACNASTGDSNAARFAKTRSVDSFSCPVDVGVVTVTALDFADSFAGLALSNAVTA
jgi:hypothetical protein